MASWDNGSASAAAGSQLQCFYSFIDQVLTAANVHVQVPDWTKDNAAGRKILEHVGVPVFEVPGFRLEGGSIHSDGQGTLIVTEQCLLHPSRNPDLGKSGIEAVSPDASIAVRPIS